MFIILSKTLLYDVPIWEQLLRLFLAAILGAIFGIERELKNKPAGFITFMLVLLGSCLIALLQLNLIKMVIEANSDAIGKADPGRIIAQVVSGVGFLGAGTIIHNRGNVKGITTAALLWVSAAVGLVVGVGGISNYVIAIATCLLFFPLSLIVRKLGRKFAENKRVHRVLIIFDEKYEKDLINILVNQGAIIKKTFFHNKYHDNGKSYKEVYFYLSLSKHLDYEDFISSLSNCSIIEQIEEA